MKYNYFLIFLLLCSCTSTSVNKYEKPVLNSKGFAYIYTLKDYENKFIKKKINSDELIIAHNKVKRGSLLKITNPNNGKNIILKNSFRLDYPDFYKVLITKPVSNQIGLNENFPYVEVEEIKKNKSFIAKKTKIFNEEKKVHTKAPVEIVKIDNISLNKSQKKKISEEFNIIIAEFYSKDSATFLKKRITSELPSFNSKKLYIKSSNLNKISLLSGPYKSINVMKNDYIQLEKFGFEELDIGLNE